MHDPALKERAKELRGQGLLIRQIADEIGVPKPTVIRWMNPKLEERGRARARKLKYKGATRCPKCKRKKTVRAKMCRACYMSSQRYWTRDLVIEAIQAWAAEKGHAPVHGEWQKSGGKKHPALRTILDGPDPPFASWSEALLAAGFTPRQHRSKPEYKLTPQQRAAIRREIREQRIRKAIGKEV